MITSRKTAATNSGANTVFKWMLCFALLAFCEWFFFRNVIGTDALLGNSGDGRLTMLVTEHWFHVFQGQSSIPDLGIFYPIEDTLGFSDMMLAFGLIHSVFRFAGLDVYLAYKTTLIVVHAIGTLTTFLFLAKSLRVDWKWSLFGTVAFSFSNAYAIHIFHTQLIAISLLPVLGILIVAFLRHTDRRFWRNAIAVAFILMAALLVYTAWYVAFFTALFATLSILSGVVVCLWRRHKVIAPVISFVKTIGVDLIWYALLLVGLLVPFVLMEIPALKLSGGRSYAEVMTYAPEVIDVINVSSDNYLLGPLIEKMGLDSRGKTMESIQGFSIVLLTVFFSGIALSSRHAELSRSRNARMQLIICEVFALATIVGVALPLSLSDNGVSLWWFVYKLFPGASSIRAAARFLLYLSLPMSIVAAAYGDYLMQSPRNGVFQRSSKATGVLTGLLIAAAFVANIHVGGVDSSWSRSEQLDFISNVAPAPEMCETMVIIGDETSDPAFAQLDAYVIADAMGLNTINGYSGVFPNEWGGIWDVSGPAYESSVQAWIALYDLKNVYAYDRAANQWRAL